MHILTPLLVDWISVVADGPPEAHGFARRGEDKHYPYRDGEGWSARGVTHERTGRMYTWASLSGEPCAMRQEPMMRWRGPVKLTRIDVTRDVIGLPLDAALAGMFAGTRRGRKRQGVTPSPLHSWHSGTKGETLYIGSPDSPLRLRVYHKNNLAGEVLKELWRRGGWGGEDVTRLEYQCRTKHVERAVCWNGCHEDWWPQVTALWNDAIARIRLCTVMPGLCRQANEAPTHPFWRELAFDAPRKLAAPKVQEQPPSEEAIARAMERFAERGGDVRALGKVVDSLMKVWRPR